MGEKISTIVLKVDLECERCYKKMRRVLCRIQDKMNIKMISFDEKTGTVTVAGPFDTEKVCRKLYSEAGKVIKDLSVNGGKGGKDSKDGGGGEKPKVAKEGGKDGKEKAGEKKDGGKGEKDGGKGEKDGGKGEKVKDGKAGEKKDGGKGEKDGKDAKKVTFDLGEAPPAAAAVKPGKAMPPLPAGMTKADLAPLLEKIMQAKQGGGGGGPEPPRGEPMVPPAAAAQGVAVPSIWPAPAGPVSCYSYNPSAYDQSPYYGGGAPAAGGYYGVPVQYDNQGWYYGNGRQPYYPQQHHHHQQQPYCGEDPNAACTVM